MKIKFSRRFTAKIVFFAGILLMTIGSIFLLGSREDVSKLNVFISFFFVLAGISLGVFAIILNKRSIYLFFSALFLQVGIFLFLFAMQIITLDFFKTWPLLAIFCGLALIPTSRRHYGRFRLAYIVPSISLIIIGAGLLVFSFGLLDFSLAQFVYKWWPVFLFISGLILLLLSLANKKSIDKNNSKDNNK
jgi:hypothetical protein